MTGYQINPTEKFINLRDVESQDNNGLMRRMHNLEKNFMEFDINLLDKTGTLMRERINNN